MKLGTKLWLEPVSLGAARAFLIGRLAIGWQTIAAISENYILDLCETPSSNQPIVANKELFKKFLERCQQDNITVWADPDLKRNKGTTGHWNGGEHISVFRAGSAVVGVLPQSNGDRIETFIEGSPDVQSEIAILLHEYGHWASKHPTDAEPKLKYEQETEAWNKGEELARLLGMTDFAIYHKMRDEALAGYKMGLGIVP